MRLTNWGCRSCEADQPGGGKKVRREPHIERSRGLAMSLRVALIVPGDLTAIYGDALPARR